MDPPDFSSLEKIESQEAILQRKRKQKTQLFLIFSAIAGASLRNRVRDSILSGSGYISEVLEGNEVRLVENFRMTRPSFLYLSNLLRETTAVKDTRLCVEEKLGIFLLISGTGCSVRVAQERFQRSGCTIVRCFREVMFGILKNHHVFIIPTRQETFKRVKEDSRYPPMFDFCLGAVDGTMIPINVPEGKDYYRCRKGFGALNVLVVTDFNLKFRYILSGWPGSAHDSRVIDNAFNRNFVIPEGYFFLGDAGYELKSNLLTPYRRTRYHLKEFQSNNRPENPRELYNLRHSSLRVTVERSIGVLKKRFQLIGKSSSYSPAKMTALITCFAALHNFLVDQKEELPTVEEGATDSPQEPPLSSASTSVSAKTFRDRIAETMWLGYQQSGQSQ